MVSEYFVLRLVLSRSVCLHYSDEEEEKEERGRSVPFGCHYQSGSGKGRMCRYGADSVRSGGRTQGNAQWNGNERERNNGSSPKPSGLTEDTVEGG